MRSHFTYGASLAAASSRDSNSAACPARASRNAVSNSVSSQMALTVVWQRGQRGVSRQHSSKQAAQNLWGQDPMADRWICSRQMTHSPVCSSDSSVLSASAQVQDDGNGAGCLSGAAGTLVAGGRCAARASRSGCGGGIASCRAPASPQPLGRHAARRSIRPPKTMATVTGSIQGCSLKSNVVSANRLSLVLNSSATSEGGNALSIPPGCTIALIISPWRPPTAIAARSMTLSKPAQSRRTSSGASCCIYFAARRAGVCVFGHDQSSVCSRLPLSLWHVSRRARKSNAVAHATNEEGPC